MTDGTGDGLPPETFAADSRGLLELLRDQRQRWRGGSPLSLETYLQQQPTLRGDAEAVLDLIYNEIILRQQNGEVPQPDEYLARFPDVADRLRQLFEVDAALALPVRPALPATLGRFEIRRQLGKGGFGTVYLAHDPHL